MPTSVFDSSSTVDGDSLLQHHMYIYVYICIYIYIYIYLTNTKQIPHTKKPIYLLTLICVPCIATGSAWSRPYPILG